MRRKQRLMIKGQRIDRKRIPNLIQVLNLLRVVQIDLLVQIVHLPSFRVVQRNMYRPSQRQNIHTMRTIRKMNGQNVGTKSGK